MPQKNIVERFSDKAKKAIHEDNPKELNKVLDKIECICKTARDGISQNPLERVKEVKTNNNVTLPNKPQGAKKKTL